MPRNRQSFFYPILGAVLAILFTIAVLVAWSIIFTKYYVLATETQMIPDLGVGYWLILSTGCVFLVMVITTLALFLTTTIRQTLYMRRQDSFIDSMTHELKSPLASLKLGLETMELRKLSPEMQARFLAMMKKDVDRLQAFIEHVLEAGRLEHNERSMKEEPTILPELLDQCIRQVCQRHNLPTDAVTVTRTMKALDRPIITDPVALEIVMLNLLDNAIKYSDRDGLEVHVDIGEEELRWIVLAVRDRGRGIPKKHLKRIFKRFIRVERNDKPKVQGTGLGLYVVASLVKRLGGKIQATSDGENMGATFTARLPLKRPTQEAW